MNLIKSREFLCPFCLLHVHKLIYVPLDIYFAIFFCEVSLLSFIFHAGKPISSGKVVIDVSYFGVHVHTENHDLSEEISCPIAAGKFVLSHSQTLPGFTPPVSLI